MPRSATLSENGERYLPYYTDDDRLSSYRNGNEVLIRRGQYASIDVTGGLRMPADAQPISARSWPIA